MGPDEKKESSAPDGAADAAESLEELLAHEPYVYQGKVYSRKRLYRGSSARMFIVGGYLAFMLVVVGGVVAWTYGVSFTLPSFILGINEADTPPTVRTPHPSAPKPAATTTPTQATTTPLMATSTETPSPADNASSTVETTVPNATSTSTPLTDERLGATSTNASSTVAP